MSTDTIWETSSTSSDATEAIGEAIGKQLKGGEVIELVSDLGGGKTTLVRGLAKGLESKDIVSSPTFMLEKVYSGRLELHHYDLFRLGESGIVGLELAEVFDDPSSVKVIEWGGVAGDLLPNERLVITIKVTSEESRAFVFSIPSKLAYLLETIS